MILLVVWKCSLNPTNLGIYTHVDVSRMPSWILLSKASFAEHRTVGSGWEGVAGTQLNWWNRGVAALVLGVCASDSEFSFSSEIIVASGLDLCWCKAFCGLKENNLAPFYALRVLCSVIAPGLSTW